MDDLKRCAPPDPEPTWPVAARGTSVVVSTRAPSTLARSDATRVGNPSGTSSHHPRISAHPDSVISDMRAPSHHPRDQRAP